MTDIEIFTQALELSTPWEVMEVSFKKEGSKKVLHIHVGYQKGSRFDYEGKDYSVYDHQRRTWRHIDFFQYECYLHARIPRIKTEEGKVKLVKVPWAEEGSSFSLLFERKVLELVQNGMNVSRAGRTIGIGSGQVYRIIKRMVVDALLDQEVGVVKELSIDETSSKKGHNYLTILCDRAAKKVVGIGLGKLTDSVEEGLQEMEFRGGSRSDIRCVTMDMWKAYISAAQEKMSQADIVFDRFHLAYNLNKVIDRIRRMEQGKFSELKRTKYLWLRKHENLKDEQKDFIEDLSNQFKTIGEAYRLKELFREVLNHAQEDPRLKWLNAWMNEAWASGIQPIRQFVNMLRDHWYGIKTYFKKLATNAFAERVNLKIQEIKRIAKGYRNINNYKMMIYLHLGGLNFE
jgi:transposase